MLKKKRAFIVSVCMCALLVFAISLAGCGGSSEPKKEQPAQTSTTQQKPAEVKLIKDGTLIVGSDCDYPPFISLDGDTPVGFEYDLMTQIAELLDYKLEYMPPQKFDNILPSLASGATMDLGVSSFTINDERLEIIDFSDSYMNANQAIVVKSGATYTSAADLKGLSVGAQAGTTGEDWGKENISGITMKGYDATTDAINALLSGDVEGIIYDSPIAAWHEKDMYAGKIKVVEVIPTGETYGIAVNKDNPVLLEKINECLKTLHDNGTYDKLFNKYFTK